MALSRTAGFVSSVALALTAVGVAGATPTLFVSDWDSNIIGEYNANTGAAINTSSLPSVASGEATGVAVAGHNLFVGDSNLGTVQEYNVSTGAAISAPLVSGLNKPASIAVSGSNLFVANTNGTVGEYNANTGVTVNASLISGLNNPDSVAVSGPNLFVTEATGRVGEYSASMGAPINSSLVSSGLSNPTGLAVSGSNLFVANSNATGTAGTVGEYNASTGTPINTSLISGLRFPAGITLSGSNLFVANFGNGTVGEYNASTGTPINTALVSGLARPLSMAVANVTATPMAKVKLPDGFVYSVPLLSNIYDLKGFSVTQNGKQVDLNSLSSGTLSKLISYSQALSQMKNFDASKMSSTLASEATSAKQRFDQTKWANFVKTSAGAVIGTLANTVRDGIVCLATGANLACDAAGAALSIDSAAVDVANNGEKLNNDLAFAKLADNLASNLVNTPKGQTSSPLDTAANKGYTLYNNAFNGETLSYHDFVNAYTKFEKVNAEANIALKLLKQVGVSQPDILSNTVGTFSTFDISSFLKSAEGAVQANDSKQLLSYARSLVNSVGQSQFGAFGENYIAYDQVLAGCQGITDGNCPATYVGTTAKNAEPPPYAAAFVIQHPFHMTIKPTNFGQGTDPTYGGTYKSITLSDGTSAGELTAGSSSTASGSLTTMALAFSLSSVTPPPGIPVAISTLLNMPSHASSLSFGYRFLSDSGYLKILLNHILLGTINAPATLRSGFSQYFINVDNSNLWGLKHASLGFIYGGPAGSRVLFDNVQVSDASFSSVPEPGSLWIFLSGGLIIILLASRQRRRCRSGH